MAADIPAAIAFYSRVIGWSVESWGASGPDAYQMWKTPGGRTIGGVMKLPEAAKNMGAPPHWMGNLVVQSTDAALELVKTGPTTSGWMAWTQPSQRQPTIKPR